MKVTSRKYLKAIFMLKNQKGKVRSVDLAHYLHITKPSVSVAIHALEKEGFLTIDKKKYLNLTKVGEEIAYKICERYFFFLKALLCLGVDPVIAQEDANRVEHYVSDESFSIMKEYCNKG